MKLIAKRKKNTAASAPDKIIIMCNYEDVDGSQKKFIKEVSFESSFEVPDHIAASVLAAPNLRGVVQIDTRVEAVKAPEKTKMVEKANVHI